MIVCVSERMERMNKKRPNVDKVCYDAATDLLHGTGDKYKALLPDIREDLIWELAAEFQGVYESFSEEQKLD